MPKKKGGKKKSGKGLRAVAGAAPAPEVESFTPMSILPPEQYYVKIKVQIPNWKFRCFQYTMLSSVNVFVLKDCIRRELGNVSRLKLYKDVVEDAMELDDDSAPLWRYGIGRNPKELPRGVKPPTRVPRGAHGRYPAGASTAQRSEPSDPTDATGDEDEDEEEEEEEENENEDGDDGDGDGDGDGDRDGDGDGDAPEAGPGGNEEEEGEEKEGERAVVTERAAKGGIRPVTVPSRISEYTLLCDFAPEAPDNPLLLASLGTR